MIAECCVLGSGLKYDFCGCLLREDMSLVVKTMKDLCEICEGVSRTCKLFRQGNSLVLYASNPRFESKWDALKMLLPYEFSWLKLFRFKEIEAKNEEPEGAPPLLQTQDHTVKHKADHSKDLQQKRYSL